MSRVVLVVPAATYRAGAFVRAAEQLGCAVTIATEGSQAFAEPGNDRFLPLDLERPESAADAIVELGRRTEVDAVVPVDDGGVIAAAIANERLGLLGHPPHAARATRDKGAMRHLLADAGVAQPAFELVEAERGADACAAAGARLGYPVVCKPVGLAGSRGVIRADSAEAVRAAYERIVAIDAESDAPCAEVLVERFVPGREIAIEAVLDRGELCVLAVFDKPDAPDGPYFEEATYVTPSRLAPEALEGAISTTAASCAAIGLSHGAVHAELRITGPDRRPSPIFLEAAARSIGGRCGDTLRFRGGASLEQVVLENALGRRGAPGQAEAASGVRMLPIPRSGRFLGIEGTDDALAIDGVTGLELTVPRGAHVRALPEGDRYLGFLFARGDAPADVEEALRKAMEALTIVVVGEAAELVANGRPPQ